MSTIESAMADQSIRVESVRPGFHQMVGTFIWTGGSKVMRLEKISDKITRSLAELRHPQVVDPKALSHLPNAAATDPKKKVWGEWRSQRTSPHRQTHVLRWNATKLHLLKPRLYPELRQLILHSSYERTPAYDLSSDTDGIFQFFPELTHLKCESRSLNFTSLHVPHCAIPPVLQRLLYISIDGAQDGMLSLPPARCFHARSRFVLNQFHVEDTLQDVVDDYMMDLMTAKLDAFVFNAQPSYTPHALMYAVMLTGGVRRALQIHDEFPADQTVPYLNNNKVLAKTTALMSLSDMEYLMLDSETAASTFLALKPPAMPKLKELYLTFSGWSRADQSPAHRLLGLDRSLQAMGHVCDQFKNNEVKPHLTFQIQDDAREFARLLWKMLHEKLPRHSMTICSSQSLLSLTDQSSDFFMFWDQLIRESIPGIRSRFLLHDGAYSYVLFDDEKLPQLEILVIAYPVSPQLRLESFDEPMSCPRINCLTTPDDDHVYNAHLNYHAYIL